MYLVDTNIFLEVMLAQARKSECKSFLNMARMGDVKVFATDFSIYSIMVIAGNLKKMDQLKVFLSSLSAYKGLSIYRCGVAAMLRAVQASIEHRLDIDDAMQYSAARALGVKSIVSFDKHFDGMDIPREEPNQLITRG